jgi:hypothetical protein
VASAVKKKFGHLEDDGWFLGSEAEMKKMVNYFRPLVHLRT